MDWQTIATILGALGVLGGYLWNLRGELVSARKDIDELKDRKVGQAEYTATMVTQETLRQEQTSLREQVLEVRIELAENRGRDQGHEDIQGKAIELIGNDTGTKQ